jgi:hypothetical protein
MTDSLTFNLHRPGAIAELNLDTHHLEVLAVACVEFLAPGRVPSLSVRGDLPLKPGVIYKAFTGVSADFQFPFLGCLVRPCVDAWRYGVEVKRIDFGEGGELLIYFTVLEQLRMDQAPLRFEIMDPQRLRFPDLITQDGPRLSLPGIKIALEPVSTRKIVERPVANPGTQGTANGKQMSEAEAQKKAADWLNTPDEKGKIVGGSDEVIARQVTKPAQVTAAVAPKDMKSNLSRGVVTAPLRPTHPELGSGADGPRPADPTLKEEFTVLTPQAERQADPVSNLDGV